jgi:LPXTG-motif cell wall-anchored protein
VQAYDVLRGRLLAKPILDPDEPGEKMRGNPLSRAMSADGRWAYTLYDGAGATPFVHALDTVGRSAQCSDLDRIASGTDLCQLRHGIARDGRHRVVRDSVTPLLLIDLGTLGGARAPVAEAASDGTQQFPLLLAAGGAAIVALAAGVIWTRRRKRRTLIRNLDPQSEA